MKFQRQLSLTLQAPTPQNGQTHSNNLSANSLLMCLTFHIRVAHFFDILKKKSLHEISMFIRTNKVFPGLPKLDAHIRYAQN